MAFRDSFWIDSFSVLGTATPEQVFSEAAASRLSTLVHLRWALPLNGSVVSFP